MLRAGDILERDFDFTSRYLRQTVIQAWNGKGWTLTSNPTALFK